MDVVEIAVAAGPDVVGDGEGLEAFANELNSLFATRGVQFTVDLLDGGNGSSPADIGEGARYFYVLFGREADPAVEAAFDAALARGKKAGATGVYTYFRTLDGSTPGQDVAAEVQAFMKRLDGELQHYWSTYGHVDALKLKVLLEIERDTGGAKVEVKEGKTLFDGTEVTGINMGNVPMYANNKALAQLKADYEAANTACLAAFDSGDQVVFLEADKKRKELWDSLRELERDILGLAKTISKEEATGGSVWLREASRLAEAGDIDGALRVLDDPQRQAELERAHELGEASVQGVNRWLGEQKTKAELYLQKGRTETAIENAIRAYEQAVTELEKSPLADPAILDDYAYFLHGINRYSRSIEVLDLRLRLAALNPDPAKRRPLATLNNFANLLQETGRASEAEPLHREALDIFRQLAATEPIRYQPVIAGSLNNLANVLAVMGRGSEAEPLYREALDIFRQLTATNPTYQPNLAESLANLAKFLTDIGQISEAEPLHREALDIFRQLTATNPTYQPKVAGTLNNLANLLQGASLFNEAEPLYREALNISRQLVAVEPTVYQPSMAQYLRNLAVLLNNTNRASEAEPLYREALNIYQQLTKSEPNLYQADIADISNSLAILLLETGRTSDAEILHREALGIRRQLAETKLVSYQSGLASSLYNLAVLLSKVGRADEAEPLCCEALDIYRVLAQTEPTTYQPYVAKALLAHAFLLFQMSREPELVLTLRKWLEVYSVMDSNQQENYRDDAEFIRSTLSKFEIASTIHSDEKTCKAVSCKGRFYLS